MRVFIPLLADVTDFIVPAFVVLFFIVSWAVKALGGVVGGDAKKPGQPARPQQLPGPGPGQNKPLRDEVEEFLRRAKANQPGKVKAIAPPPARGGGSVVKAEVIEAEVFDGPRGGGVAEHVERHIVPNPVAEHTRQLGREIGLADEHLESHLHETFDHGLGRLGDGSTALPSQIAQGTDAEVWKSGDSSEPQQAGELSLADEIVAMFREPGDARKAIVLGEILNPPERRWE